MQSTRGSLIYLCGWWFPPTHIVVTCLPGPLAARKAFTCGHIHKLHLHNCTLDLRIINCSTGHGTKPEQTWTSDHIEAKSTFVNENSPVVHWPLFFIRESVLSCRPRYDYLTAESADKWLNTQYLAYPGGPGRHERIPLEKRPQQRVHLGHVRA